MREMRKLPGEQLIIIDQRKIFSFRLPDGRRVETKADSNEEARKHIEECLELEFELQEAA